MRAQRIWLLGLTIAAGCGKKTDGDSAAATKPTEAVLPLGAMPIAPPSGGTTTRRLGPFELRKPIDLAGMTVKWATGTCSLVVTSGSLQLELTPHGDTGKIMSIETKTKGVPTSVGIEVGQAASDLASKLPDATCDFTKYDAECSSPRDPDITYRFDSEGDLNRPNGAAISKITPAATISSIIWLDPSHPVDVKGVPASPQCGGSKPPGSIPSAAAGPPDDISDAPDVTTLCEEEFAGYEAHKYLAAPAHKRSVVLEKLVDEAFASGATAVYIGVVGMNYDQFDLEVIAPASKPERQRVMDWVAKKKSPKITVDVKGPRCAWLSPR